MLIKVSAVVAMSVKVASIVNQTKYVLVHSVRLLFYITHKLR